jgi:hypothetical protein
MTATTIKPPRSRAAILADTTLSPWAKGQEISAISKWEAENPVPPESPLPLSIGERAQSESIKTALIKLATNFETLDVRQNKYGDELPAMQEKFQTTQSANLPDAPHDAIQDEIIQEKRLQKMRHFLANAPRERELLERQMSGHFATLNHLLARFKTQQLFLSGSRPAHTARNCVSFLEQFLKQQ